MSLKKEFVIQAILDDSNVSEICRRFEISRPTGYKWLNRYIEEGEDGLAERSRRPVNSPSQTAHEVEEAVLKVRDGNPTWGGRKIRRYLENHGHRDVPSASTVTTILKRHGRPVGGRGAAGGWKRFERGEPMELLQMDFKGHFPIRGGRCHPLSVIDDHSRYLLGLDACGDECGGTVRERLQKIFRRHGLPDSIITDNGSPWAVPRSKESFSSLGVWLIRLGIRLLNSAEYHPQTCGKVERFHRTLKAEVVQARSFRDLGECQRAFDKWREVYNFERPHEAIGMQTPSERFRPSTRSYPERLPEIAYGDDDEVRKVQDGGLISFRGKTYRVGKAFKGLPVAVRPTVDDGVFDVYCIRQKLLRISITASDAPLGGHP